MGIPPFRHSCSFKCVTLIFSFQRAAAVPPAVAADPAADDRHGPHRHLEAHRPGRHLQFQGLQDRPQRPPVRSQLGMLIVNRPIQLFEILSKQWIDRLRVKRLQLGFFRENWEIFQKFQYRVLQNFCFNIRSIFLGQNFV